MLINCINKFFSSNYLTSYFLLIISVYLYYNKINYTSIKNYFKNKINYWNKNQIVYFGDSHEYNLQYEMEQLELNHELD